MPNVSVRKSACTQPALSCSLTARLLPIAPLADEVMAAARGVYDRLIAPHVHQRW